MELGPGCSLGPHVVLHGPSFFGAGNRFFAGAAVGADPQDLKFKGERTELLVGERNIFREYVTVSRGTESGGGKTTIGSECLFMAYVHIAHDCHVGDRVILANCVTLAGHVEIEDDAVVGGLTPIHQFVRIGRGAFVGGMTRLSMSVTPFTKVAGVPSRVLGTNRVGLERRGLTPRGLRRRADASLLFRQGLNTTDAMAASASEITPTPDVEEILSSGPRGQTRRYE